MSLSMKCCSYVQLQAFLVTIMKGEYERNYQSIINYAHEGTISIFECKCKYARELSIQLNFMASILILKAA